VPPGGLPMAEDVYPRLLALPMHCRMTEDDAMRVATTLTAILREGRR
jgi:dTDP-4-amino-4,6-dideoxygalactose transaminase